MGYSEATITASSFVIPPAAEGDAVARLARWLEVEFRYDLPDPVRGPPPPGNVSARSRSGGPRVALAPSELDGGTPVHHTS